MKNKRIVKFADSEKDSNGDYTHWIEFEDGGRFDASDNEITKIWMVWVSSFGAKRYKDEANFSVYEFKTPTKVNF